MGIARLIVLFCSVWGATACQAADHRFKQASERNLFRNFTLAVCMGTAYQGASQKLADDVGKAANGYMEFGHMGLEAYEEARGLINSWLKKDYQSKAGGQVDIMKCIDLYESEDLQKLFEKHDPCKNPAQWLDEEAFKARCK